MRYQAFVLLASLALLLGLTSAEEFEVKSTAVLFIENKTYSNMYIEKRLTVLVDKSIDLKLEHVVSSDTYFLEVVGVETLNCTKKTPCPSQDKYEFPIEKFDNYRFYSIIMQPHIIGKVDLTFFPRTENATSPMPSIEIIHQVVIKEPMRAVDMFFRVFVWFMGVFFSTMLGILLEKEQLKTCLENPVAPILGFCIQYTIMPLLAFSFVRLFSFGPVEALALFLYGCCPGGNASNNWTILFDGDLNLSAIMTFASNIGSLVMIPLWLYTLGQTLMDSADIQIPFLMLFANLLIVVVPCVIGYFISAKHPHIRLTALKYAKPFTLIFLCCFLTFVFYTKWYTFKLMKWYYFLGAPMIPWTGYAVSFVLANVFRLPWKQVKTVGIETGIQNVGIAFLIILTNFPSPEAEYAFLPLVAVALFTGFPLYIVYIIRQLVRCLKNRFNKEADQTNIDEEASTRRSVNPKVVFVQKPYIDYKLVKKTAELVASPLENVG